MIRSRQCFEEKQRDEPVRAVLFRPVPSGSFCVTRFSSKGSTYLWPPLLHVLDRDVCDIPSDQIQSLHAQPSLARHFQDILKSTNLGHACDTW
jgi:hypothetical protein